MGLYLGKQSIIAINEKVATKQWVYNQAYLTETNLSDYIKNEQFEAVSNNVADIDASVADLSTNVIRKGSLGKINGQSIENGNNVTIDLTLYKVVNQLPTTDIDENKIYLMPNPAGKDNNTYIEYMYINGVWEKVGEYQSKMSLEDYYTKEEADNKYLSKDDAGNLSDYIKTGDLDQKVGDAGYIKETQANTLIGTAIDGFKKIILITESDYNSLVSAGTVDNNVVYMTYSV